MPGQARPDPGHSPPDPGSPAPAPGSRVSDAQVASLTPGRATQTPGRRLVKRKVSFPLAGQRLGTWGISSPTRIWRLPIALRHHFLRNSINARPDRPVASRLLSPARQVCPHHLHTELSRSRATRRAPRPPRPCEKGAVDAALMHGTIWGLGPEDREWSVRREAFRRVRLRQDSFGALPPRVPPRTLRRAAHCFSAVRAINDGFASGPSRTMRRWTARQYSSSSA